MKTLKIIMSIALAVLIAGAMWAQDKSDSSSINSVVFTVEVIYMTQGGTRMTDSILVFAADLRAADRDAEAQFKRMNSRSTFIRAVATVEALPLQGSERTRPEPSAGRYVNPNPDGTILFSVEVTSMTQGGTRRTDTITVHASGPREAEREAEAHFKRTNSRSTFIRAVAQ
jgi:hypothetical protein